MGRVITEMLPTVKAFEVGFLLDAAQKSIAMAKAFNIVIVCEEFTGVYEIDMGLFSTDASSIYRYRPDISAECVKTNVNLTHEFLSPLGNRTINQRACQTFVSTLENTVFVTELKTEKQQYFSIIYEARGEIGESLQPLLNIDGHLDNIDQNISVAERVVLEASK